MILDHRGQPYKSTRADSWYNPVTGYGGADDNIENTTYNPDPPVGEWQANWIYENSGVVSRGIEAPVKDRLSKGVDFVTNDDDSEGRKKEIEAVENDIKTSKVWDKFIEANFWGRLHGGGLLYFDFGDDRLIPDLQRPINFELRDSQRGQPNKIWTVDRWQAIPQSYYTEHIHGADHPKLGEVEIYSLNLHTTGYAKLIFAHESRCIKVDGLAYSNRSRAANLMWGNSVLTRIFKVARMMGISLKSATDILEDWNYKSVGIPNLTDKLISNEDEDIQAMFQAVGLAAKSAHNQNIGMHDADGDLTKHTTQASGITDVVSMLVNFYCGELGIPYSRLFSAEGGAMAGTAAETDVKNYHESLRYDQNHRDRPHVERMLWLLGYEPENFPFIWPPLHESTRLEQIEERDKQADVDTKYIQSGVVLPEEVRASRFSTPEVNLDQMIIDHSLDSMVERDEEDMEEEKDEPEPDKEKDDKRTDSEEEDIELYISETIKINPEDVQ